MKIRHLHIEMVGLKQHLLIMHRLDTSTIIAMSLQVRAELTQVFLKARPD